jgi:heme o synthase
MNGGTVEGQHVTAVARGGITEFYELTKPRIVLMVLVTTLAGFYLGTQGSFDLALAINLMIGTALAAGGTLALNQYIERDTDAMMQRTRHRPLPSGRMRPPEALAFGSITTAAGIIYLAATANLLCAAVTATVTIVYLLAYTPMKRVSWMCNIIGAIPGALPPVAGWAAARGSLAIEPFLLFGLMFLWQLPHTFAVGRLYRADYARAGIHLLPDNTARGGNPSNPVVIAASLGLVALGVIPTMMGLTGLVYTGIAVALGGTTLTLAILMMRRSGGLAAARRVLLFSLIYLPLVLLAMVLDRV